MPIVNQCPVCQARFRGARICSRCGADLEPLMVISVKAWKLREAARQALLVGEIGRALALTCEARALQRTPGPTRSATQSPDRSPSLPAPESCTPQPQT